MGCKSSVQARANVPRNDDVSGWEMVTLVQAEGYPSVRVYASKDKGASVLGEIKNHEQCKGYRDGRDFYRVSKSRLNGWVGAKNVVGAIHVDLDIADAEKNEQQRSREGLDEKALEEKRKDEERMRRIQAEAQELLRKEEEDRQAKEVEKKRKDEQRRQAQANPAPELPVEMHDDDCGPNRPSSQSSPQLRKEVDDPLSECDPAGNPFFELAGFVDLEKEPPELLHTQEVLGPRPKAGNDESVQKAKREAEKKRKEETERKKKDEAEKKRKQAANAAYEQRQKRAAEEAEAEKKRKQQAADAAYEEKLRAKLEAEEEAERKRAAEAEKKKKEAADAAHEMQKQRSKREAEEEAERKQRAEADRKKREAEEKLWLEVVKKQEQERKEREEFERRKEKEEEEARRKADADKHTQAAKEDAKKRADEEQRLKDEKRAREDAARRERRKREEQQRLQKEEADRRAKEEAERKAREVAWLEYMRQQDQKEREKKEAAKKEEERLKKAREESRRKLEEEATRLEKRKSRQVEAEAAKKAREEALNKVKEEEEKARQEQEARLREEQERTKQKNKEEEESRKWMDFMREREQKEKAEQARKDAAEAKAKEAGARKALEEKARKAKAAKETEKAAVVNGGSPAGAAAARKQKVQFAARSWTEEEFKEADPQTLLSSGALDVVMEQVTDKTAPFVDPCLWLVGVTLREAAATSKKCVGYAEEPSSEKLFEHTLNFDLDATLLRPDLNSIEHLERLADLHGRLPQLNAGIGCIKGRKTSPNQDNILFCRAGRFVISGVADGHGQDGHWISHHVARTCLALLLAEIRASNAMPLEGSVTRIFKTCHDLVALQASKDGFDVEVSGCTLTIAIGDYEANNLLLCNVGDSRGILDSGNGNSLTATEDHKPSVAIEQNRIEHCGGAVANDRVYTKDKRWGLSVTRAIGDTILQKVGVSFRPACQSFKLKDHSYFTVICSDGVWDELSNVEVSRIVQKCGRESPGAAAQEIRDTACERWSSHPREGGETDDISVVVVWY
eukprot:TRINITY_DN24023_c0_g1_i1.p1 TRINITY_DN24023_c0_g1~~TRINITY_DN24023_c0_g1_i1.p1  ORF type:complete len:1023 (-),score=342.58 TRINITY_DN24023_c0_g1_i1:110-3178(-)